MGKYIKNEKVMYDDLVWYVIRDYGELVKIGRSENNYQITCKVKRNNLLPVTSEIQKQADELTSAKNRIIELEKQLRERNAIVLGENGGMYIGTNIGDADKLMQMFTAEKAKKAIDDAVTYARKRIFDSHMDAYSIANCVLDSVTEYGKLLIENEHTL